VHLEHVGLDLGPLARLALVGLLPGLVVVFVHGVDLLEVVRRRHCRRGDDRERDARAQHRSGQPRKIRHES
jgi:hypothetical protein